MTHSVVLVEGVSDKVALEVLARRLGVDLQAHRAIVVAMDGITNIRHYLARYHTQVPALRFAGLYDDAEERFVRRGLELIGLLPAGGTDRESLEARGFFACEADLEDELIRALGEDSVERLVEAQGQLRSFRTLQRQPALRDRPLHHQLRRLMSGRTGGKARYGALMAQAVPLERVPRPLARLLAFIEDEFPQSPSTDSGIRRLHG